jgi:membrane-bound lytic murein transglycosylase D
LSRLVLLSVLCLLLSVGCAANQSTSPHAQLRLSPQVPQAAAATRSVTSALAKSTSTAAFLPPSVPALRFDPRLDRAAAEPQGDDIDPLDGEDSVTEFDDEEALDPETLEDNAVLQAADITPPEEEGETVFLDENVFDFPVVDNEKVRYFVNYFSGPVHKTMRTWLERSTRYLPMMQEVFAETGLPQDLVYLAMIESGFNNKALSRARASGPWQFMEGTGRMYGLSNDWWYDERRDPEKATRAAARHLADLYRMFDGDWYLAMAAYNAGAGKIRRAIERYDTRDFWELTHGSYLKDETKHYVPKMLAALLIAKHPERYGFTELNYQEPLAYEQVELDSVTDLEVIARLAGSDYETIKRLNPELKRWSTPPGKSSYPVRLPVGSAVAFAEQYAQLPMNQRANFVAHKVVKGDTPAALARRYGVRTDDLLRFNQVRDARSLRIGQNLLIPLNPDTGNLSLADLREALRDDAPAGRSSKATVQKYTVRSGDSLWKIAKRYQVTEQQLRSWNKLDKKALLRVGQKLVINGGAPKSHVATAAAKPKAAAKPAGKSQAQKIVYQVRAGDTLWGISRQFAVNTAQIRDWNQLPANPVLRPGQRLTLLVKDQPRS